MNLALARGRYYISLPSTPMARNVLIDLFFTFSAHGLMFSFHTLS